MKQTVKTIKARGDTQNPAFIEIDSAFTFNQEVCMEYYVHSKAIQQKGYISALQPGGYPTTGQFLVRNLYANMLTSPPGVMVELLALEPRFYLRYPVEKVMLLTEAELLERIWPKAEP